MEIVRTFSSITGKTVGEIMSNNKGYAFLHFDLFGGEVAETLREGFQTIEEAEEAFWNLHYEING